MTFVQRFGDALSLNVHFHSLVLDGVCARTPEGRLRFHVLPPPEDAEVVRVATQVARRIQRLLVRRGLADGAEPDRLGEEEALLAALYTASIGGRIATGQRVRRLGDRIDVDDLEVLEGERCASVGGVSLSANVAVRARSPGIAFTRAGSGRGDAGPRTHAPVAAARLGRAQRVVVCLRRVRAPALWKWVRAD